MNEKQEFFFFFKLAFHSFHEALNHLNTFAYRVNTNSLADLF